MSPNSSARIAALTGAIAVDNPDPPSTTVVAAPDRESLEDAAGATTNRIAGFGTRRRTGFHDRCRTAPTPRPERPGRHPAKPTEYEAVTGKFHYHFNRKPAPFDLDPEQRDQPVVPQVIARINRCGRWTGEGFRDPAALNYRRYIALQHEREVYAGRRRRSFEALDHDENLDPAWVAGARKGLPASPFRLPRPADHVAVRRPARAERLHHQRAFFQAADELQALQWIAYRAKSLSLTHGTQLANTEAT